MMLTQHSESDGCNSNGNNNNSNNNNNNSNSNDNSTLFLYNRLKKAQEFTFGLIDHMLKKSNRYEGFYILRFDNMMVEDAKIITVNNIPLSKDELKDFLIGRKHIEPYSFKMYGMSYMV